VIDVNLNFRYGVGKLGGVDMDEKLYGGLSLTEIAEGFESPLVRVLAQDLLTERKIVGMLEGLEGYVLGIAALRVKELEAQVLELEEDAKYHLGREQEAYESGLMQREGPAELSEDQQAAWHRLEDLMHTNALGVVDGDVRILMHALKSPGLQGAVTSRLASKATEDNSK
jgi:hypothetical protein